MFNRKFNRLFNTDRLFNRIVGGGNTVVGFFFLQTHKIQVSNTSNLARIFYNSSGTLAREIGLSKQIRLSRTTSNHDKPYLVFLGGSIRAVLWSIYVKVTAAATVAAPEQIMGKRIAVKRCLTGKFNRIAIPVKRFNKMSVKPTKSESSTGKL